MDILASEECSSGCDSGWTLYLEKSFLSSNPSFDGGNGCGDEMGVFCGENRDKKLIYDDDDEEDDLSMVSDASSGPPHLHEEDEEYFHGGNGFYHHPASMDSKMVKYSGKLRQKKSKEKKQCKREVKEMPCLLDDTASSPVFNFSKTNYNHTKNQGSVESTLDFSQGFSTTHYESGSAFQKHFGILHSPLSGNNLQQNQWYEGKRWG